MVRIVEQFVTGKARKVLSGELNYTTVTIHETGNESKGAGAQSHANLQSRGNPYPGSWNATVDAVVAILSYKDTERTMHSGKSEGNKHSYSIEICVNSEENFVQAVHNAAELAAIKLKAKGYGVDRLRRHKDWSGKNCPTHLIANDWGISWAEFKDLVRAHLNEQPVVTPPTPSEPYNPPKPVEPPKPTEATDDNRSLQGVLKEMGYYGGDIDGKYGPMTTDAVYRWQVKQNENGDAKLFADGVWGPISFGWYAWVKEAQTATNKFRAVLNSARVDGDYGPLYNRIVRRLQTTNGLFADGILGNKTAQWMRDKGSSLRNRP